jgi:hypothetical protein
MKNRELFTKDPLSQELLNDGVAKVLDSHKPDDLFVLRQELETFVCEGEYAKGLEHILRTFLSNLDKPKQPSVWVSGFFGSGKSHLVKMARALWVDVQFPDGATARGITRLNDEIKALLKELSNRSKTYGGLHAASGTLGAGAGDSVRLTLLDIVFRSKGLPPDYPQARFVMWLKSENVFEKVKGAVEAAGKDWDRELNALHVSPVLAKAILDHVPGFPAGDPAAVGDRLNTQFPMVEELTDAQMHDAINQALTVGGKFPLTLVALDEVQQWIGTTPDRTILVQEVTESCSARFQGKLLFIATGQAALRDTPMLQKLQDRFSIQIALSDTDVDAVLRSVVLAKRPDQVPQLETLLASCDGEISRHLNKTKILHTLQDQAFLVPDYPLLPVRRRFWEEVLKSIDQTGATAQLRSQLRVVLQAVKDKAESPLGTVVPADALFDQLTDNMLQTRTLPRRLHESIQTLRQKGPDGILKARLCALVFMIGKLRRDSGLDKNVRANEETLADLLVEDLRTGSTELRKQIPPLLTELVEDGVLMRLDKEFRVQTPEGAAWDAEYQKQRNFLSSNIAAVAAERDSRLNEAFRGLAKFNLLQGSSKVKRTVAIHTLQTNPVSDGSTLTIWVRDGWMEKESVFEKDAAAAGSESAVTFVFLPNRGGEDLTQALIDAKAAQATLDARGQQGTPEGQEAESAMKARLMMANGRVDLKLVDILENSRVLLGGGQELKDGELSTRMQKALESAMVRLFKDFAKGDDPKWPEVLKKAKEGAADALAGLGYKGDADKHPVCAEIMKAIGGGKKGKELREKFEASPYGWPGDTVDGALFVLLASGHLRASLNAKSVKANELERSKIGVADFHLEQTVVTTGQKLVVRKLAQLVGVPCASGEELIAVPTLLGKLHEFARSAAGDPPAPSLEGLSLINTVEAVSGNDQIVALAANAAAIEAQVKAWTERAEKLKKRLPGWQTLQALLKEMGDLDGGTLKAQAQAIQDQRTLLADPDPVAPLVKEANDRLRERIQQLADALSKTQKAAASSLDLDESWSKLDDAQRASIQEEAQLGSIPDLKVGTVDEVLATLRVTPLSTLETLKDALPQRYAAARRKAAQVIIPAAAQAHLPHRTLKTEAEVEAWVAEVREDLLAQVKKNPVIV